MLTRTSKDTGCKYMYCINALKVPMFFNGCVASLPTCMCLLGTKHGFVLSMDCAVQNMDTGFV